MSPPSKLSRRRDVLVKTALTVSIAINLALVVDRVLRDPPASADGAPAHAGMTPSEGLEDASGQPRAEAEGAALRDPRPMQPLDAGSQPADRFGMWGADRSAEHADLSEALVTATEQCGVSADASVSVTARIASDGRMADVRVRRGSLDASDEACVVRALTGFQTGITPEDDRFVIVWREHGAGFVTQSGVPFLDEGSLDFPGVDPAHVAHGCFEMGEYGCAVRAVRRIEAPTLIERRHLLSALVALEDWDELEAELRRVPAERASQYSAYHAVLWRIENGLPVGDVPRPSAPGPLAE